MSSVYVNKEYLAGLKTPITATNDTDIPNWLQVQNALNGITMDAARLHTHSNVDITTIGLGVIDGAQTVAGDRVLLVGQTDPIDNGVYIAGTGTWVRSADEPDGFIIKPFTTIHVLEGSDGAGHELKLSATANVTVGTDAQNWINSRNIENDAEYISVEDGAFTVLTGTDVQTVLDSVDDNLEAVFGMAATNATDITAAEAAIGAVAADLAALDVTANIQTFYDGQKFTQTGTTIAANTWTTVTHNLVEEWPSGIEVYDMDGNRETGAFNIDVIAGGNAIRIQNETATIFTDMVVVVRA